MINRGTDRIALMSSRQRSAAGQGEPLRPADAESG